MDDAPSYQLDIRGLSERDAPHGGASRRSRPWLGIHFQCCGVYTRVYRNTDGTAYVGACPRCLGRVCIRVGPGGTDARFFTAR